MAEAAPDATHRGEGVRYRQDTNTPSGLWRRPGSLWREPVRPDNEAMLRQTRGVGRVPGGQDGQRARSWRGFRPMRRVKTSTGFTCSSFGGRQAHRPLGTRSSESSACGFGADSFWVYRCRDSVSAVHKLSKPREATWQRFPTLRPTMRPHQLAGRSGRPMDATGYQSA